MEFLQSGKYSYSFNEILSVSYIGQYDRKSVRNVLNIFRDNNFVKIDYEDREAYYNWNN